MAKVLQNSYYIYKIPSNKIKGLKMYSFKEAAKDGNIVSIGDNLVLAKRDYISLYEEVQNIRKKMKSIRKEPTSKKNI